MIKKDFAPVKVYFVKSPDGVKSSRATFDKLESKLSSLKGRKFYAIMYDKPPDDTYYACVAIELEDELKPLPFETMTIPGGLYVQEKISDWHNHIQDIANTFKRLNKLYSVDHNRPSIEFYRSMNELMCRVPVLQ